MFKAKDFLEAVDAIENDKGISRTLIIGALKEALEKAIKKQLGSAEDALVRVDIDEKKLTIRLFQLRNIVAEVEDDFLEVSLEDAKKAKADCVLGETIETEIMLNDMTKATAQLAASVFKQKIAEAEKAALYEVYKDMIGEMVTGQIEKVDDRSAIVNLGRTSVYLPKAHMIPGERFRTGETIKLYVVDVISTTKGAQISVSRTDVGFLRRLLEEEVHEIYEGTVLIKSIAREAGERSKVAVMSLDPNVPASGACIGPNGVKIQKIVAQLGNGKDREKIDVINYNENPGLFIMEALKPASVIGVLLDEEHKRAIAVVMNNELSLAIGKLGVNARLAVKLTGWNIDIKEQDEAMRAGLKYMNADELRRMYEQKNAVVTPVVEPTIEETVVEDIVPEVIKDIVVEEVKVEEVKVAEPVIAPVPQVIKPVVEKTTQSVNATKKLADLEKELDMEKRRHAWAANRPERKYKKYDDNKNKFEEKKEDFLPIIANANATRMDIYTEEELAEIATEEKHDNMGEDDDVDYDEFDSYYDEE